MKNLLKRENGNMQSAEIVYLCVMVATVFGLTGWFIGYNVGQGACSHHFEEVVNTTVKGKPVAVHMCKKCGKRKITKV